MYRIFISIWILLFSVQLVANEIGKPFMQVGHTSGITSITLSPDGKMLASGSADNTIKLWNIESGKEIKTLTGHIDNIVSVAFSPNGRMIVSSSGDELISTKSLDKTIKLWDIESGKEIKTLTGHNNGVRSVAISPDGKMLASGSADNTIKLWDIESGKEIITLKGHTSVVNSISFSPDGKTIASGSYDKTIKLWDIESGKEIKTFIGHTDEITSIAFSPNRKNIASGSFDGTIKLWDIESDKEILTLSGHSDFVDSIAFSPDGKIIASGSEDETIKLWDIESDKEILTLSGHTNDVRSIIFSPDGKTIASGSDDETIKLWDIKSGKEIKTLQGNNDLTLSIDFNLDGKTIASGSDDKTIKLWDIESGKEIKTFIGHTDEVTSIAFSPNRKIIASGSLDGTIKLWDIESGKEITTFIGHADYITTITFSLNGKIFASGSWDGTIKLWDIKSARELKTFTGHTSYIESITFNLDGKTIASGSFGETNKLWDIKSGKEIRTLQQHTIADVESIAFSSDGKTIATGGSTSNTIKLWDVASRKMIKNFIGHEDGVRSLTFNPDGKTIAIGGRDKKILFLDIKSGEIIKELRGSLNDITSIKFSPDGKTIATENSNRIQNLLHTKSGKDIKTFQLYTGLNGLVFRNEKIIFSDMEANIKLLNTETGQELAQFVSFKDGEWIVMTPEGYFNASSEKAAAHMNILLDPMTVTGMDAFYDIFYRPDLVKLKLADVDISKYTGNMTFKEALKNPPPKVAITQIDGKAVDTNNTLNKDATSITFKVDESNNGGVGLIRVYQEGKLIKTIGEGTINRQSANADEIVAQEELNKKSKEEQKQLLAMNEKIAKSATIPQSIEESVAIVSAATGVNKSGEYSVDINLISGKNTITIEAFNKTNTILSLKESVVITSTIPKRQPKLYAIVVGVNEFQSSWANTLKYSENDAKDIDTLIHSIQNKGVYSDIKTYSLLGKEVTKEKLLQTIEMVKKEAKLEDTIVFYISTHGRSLNGKLYLITQDNINIPKLIDFEETFKTIQSIPALNQIFVIDACESGQANDIVSSVYDSKASVLAKSSGVHVLLATTKGTSAFESQDPSIKNGAFTYKILSTLKDKYADINKDHFISVIELSNNLKNQSSVTPSQYPVIRNVGSDVMIKSMESLDKF